ncbi:MAG: superoxide dismutase [Cu-Zn] SodC [Acinetobacter sp.]
MKVINRFTALCVFTALFSAGCSTTSLSQQTSAQKKVTINAVSPQGIEEKIGTITLQDSPQGLLLRTHLSHLPSGPHGFHIHEKGSCDPAEKDGKVGAALAAGSHFNPEHVAHHGTPLTGHKGDLPLLNVDSNGDANETLLAPRLKLSDVQGLAIVVHAGGDNYADQPKPLGGGGDRIACGVIQ